MSLLIRPLECKDAEAMRALRLLGLQTDAYAFGASYDHEREQPLSFFQDRCTPTDGKVFFGAFFKNQLVGLMSLVRETNPKTCHHANIYAVYTHPDYRGQGIAKKLLAQVIETAQSWTGLRYLQLGVAARNAAALAVYEQAGFVTWGTMESALRVDGVDYDEHFMSLDLARLCNNVTNGMSAGAQVND